MNSVAHTRNDLTCNLLSDKLYRQSQRLQVVFHTCGDFFFVQPLLNDFIVFWIEFDVISKRMTAAVTFVLCVRRTTRQLYRFLYMTNNHPKHARRTTSCTAAPYLTIIVTTISSTTVVQNCATYCYVFEQL